MEMQLPLIFLIALFMSWINKERIDFFAETLCEATKSFRCKPSLHSGNFATRSRQYDEDSTNFEQILAARKRARYLRLARPPTPAQLKMTKDKIRKKTLIQQTFREFIMYGIMTLILIFITVGKFSHDEFYLNQAVRNEFTRNGKHPFSDIKTEDDWWNWSFSALLDGVYNEASLKAEAGHGGQFYLIGTPILRQLRISNISNCKVPSLFESIIPDCISSYSLAVQETDMLNISDIKNTVGLEDKIYHQCGKAQCYNGRGFVVTLGRSRTEANSALLNIRNHRWIERRTRALTVQFALYNPPTNLFTMISLLTEMPESGGLITSSLIESVRIYRITTILDYFTMAFEIGSQTLFGLVPSPVVAWEINQETENY
ncbi:polycystin-1-like protein 1 [Ascaphus truei]|uniref:polycystin-1-like protein 1 n=1 Tax=Ascaphus truei TaxID=8439 RepID=UPI003F59E684